MITRRTSRTVYVGGVAVGGGAPISVQTMTTTHTQDVAVTVSQIKEAARAGCRIVRVAVPTMKAARCLGEVKEAVRVPVVADIHFDHKLALEAIRQGVDGIRVNPGNMRSREGVLEVVRAAKKAGIPIRIGVNSGSVHARTGEKTAALDEEDLARFMVKAALRYCEDFERLRFRDIKISLKASDVATTIEAYRLIASQCDYPLHLGVTAAGPPDVSLVKSSIGIGTLLAEGIGDTIRVSMTGPPLAEVQAGLEILRALGLAERGLEIVSCPTCGRCEIDLSRIVQEVRARLAGVKGNLQIAVMGCVVNGPGEAREADLGIAGGKGFGFLFRKGRRIKKVREAEMVDVLVQEARRLA
jgi:(E)-4-hydroxy-3-methylbut-2-enyl-diphosphate synthase